MLFCITANYTPKALDAMRENPSTNRRDALALALLPVCSGWAGGP